MRTPPAQQRFGRRSGVHGAVAAQNGELSVVCDDIQLTSAQGPLSGRPRVSPGRESGSSGGSRKGRRSAKRFSASRFAKPATSAYTTTEYMSTGGRGTRVSLEDPPDSWSAHGSGDNSGDAAKRGYKTAAVMLGLGFVIRCCAPWTMLNNRHMHPNLRPLLAPGSWFFLLFAPLVLANLGQIAAYATRTLRNNAIWRQKTGIPLANAYPLFYGIIDCCWVWLMTRKTGNNMVPVCLAYAVLNLTISSLGSLHVKIARRENIAGVWHLKTRQTTRARDFWLLELPATLQLTWACIVFVASLSYFLIYDVTIRAKTFEDLFGAAMSSRQMLTVYLTLALIVFLTTGLFAGKRRSNPSSAMMCALVLFDWMDDLSKVPDFSLSPQISFVDPVLVLDGLIKTCRIIGCVMAAFAVFGLAVHGRNYWIKRKQVKAADGTYSFVGGKSLYGARTVHGADLRSTLSSAKSGKLGRRPSEFLIVHSSSNQASDSDDSDTFEKRNNGSSGSDDWATAGRKDTVVPINSRTPQRGPI